MKEKAVQITAGERASAKRVAAYLEHDGRRSLPALLRDPTREDHQRSPCAARSAPPIRSVPSQYGVRARIGFLQLHAPVFQLFKRDGRAGDCAPYKSPRLDDAEIPVEELDLRLPGHGRRSIKTIEHVRLLHNRCSKGIFSLEHGGNRPSRSTVRGTHRGDLARSVLTGPSGPQPQWPRWDIPAHIR